MKYIWSPEDLNLMHQKRISRSGKELWDYVRNLSNLEGCVTGEMAMKIKNNYGLSPEDVILICRSHGKTIDNVEFNKLLKEEFESPKAIKSYYIEV